MGTRLAAIAVLVLGGFCALAAPASADTHQTRVAASAQIDSDALDLLANVSARVAAELGL
jgi:hypothetical protein